MRARLSLLSGEGKPVGSTRRFWSRIWISEALSFVDDVPERVAVDGGVVEPVHKDRPIEDRLWLMGMASMTS